MMLEVESVQFAVCSYAAIGKIKVECSTEVEVLQV